MATTAHAVFNKLRHQTDARHFQIAFLGSFFLYGMLILGWKDDLYRFPLILGTALLVQAIAQKLTRGTWIDQSLKSAMISSLGLTLLFRANEPATYALAAVLAIGSKYILQSGGRHFMNPANFGIIATMLITGDGWISPGQWGSNAIIMLLVFLPGLIVVFNASRLDTAFTFLLTLFCLDTLRTIVYLNWDWPVLFHKYQNGSLLLFTFFMITDPVTTPSHPGARIAWAMMVAALTFYAGTFMFMHTAPVWILFFCSMATPLLNAIFRYKKFEWTETFRLKPILLPGMMIALLLPQTGKAFCGFYVAKADASLFNNKSQVIISRNGNRNTITMSSDYKGDVKDFAMVVPVPTVLKRNDIRVVENRLFRILDEYSAPRMASYYDENPCQPAIYEAYPMTSDALQLESVVKKEKSVTRKSLGVTIEARYEVDEYEVLILSATQSEGLKIWLTQNGYKIPEKAAPILEPYIKSNMKFFVVKVDLNKLTSFNANGFNELRPIQISFDSPKFMLPIRLGMANSSGDQDMVVYALTRSGRIETANYRTVKMPTDREVPLFVSAHFGNFYKDLFNKTWKQEGKNAVFLEYAWNVSPSFGVKCDPCVGNPPMYNELLSAGAEWMSTSDPNRAWNGGAEVFFTRLHVRYSNELFPQDLMFIETPNKDHFQCRYVIHYPATGDLSCEAGQQYLQNLGMRKQRELQELYALTGWHRRDFSEYLRKSDFVPAQPDKTEKGETTPLSTGDNEPPSKPPGAMEIINMILLAAAAIFIIRLPHIKEQRKSAA
jgi:Na+-transporting NADH:ubiquinone oxidoreductase subunit NqrB